MLYRRDDGSAVMARTTDAGAAQEAVDTLQQAVKKIEAAYEHLNGEQHARLRAMAGHLMAMLEDE